MTKLSEMQRETYNYIKEQGEVQTTNLPDKSMSGAIPNLIDKGLVEVYNKYTNRYFRSRKKKFVKIKNSSQD